MIYYVIARIGYFVLTYWMAKGAIFTKYEGKRALEEYRMPIWMLLIMYLVYLIPVFGEIVFVLWCMWFFLWCIIKPHGCYSSYLLITLSEKNRLHRILMSIIKIVTRSL